MRNVFFKALAVSLLGGLVTAQSYVGEGPFVFGGKPTSNPKLGKTGLGNGVSEVGQILLIPQKDNTGKLIPDMFWAALTVKSTATWAKGRWDAMTGTWNDKTQTFTRMNWVDHINSTGDEFAATISADGKVFATDTPTNHPIGLGSPVFATRTDVTKPFGVPKKITGIPSGFLDSQFATINGKLSYLYINGTDLWVGEFNAATGAVTKNRALVRQRSPASQLHSTSPMNAMNDETRSVIFSAQISGKGSNAWFNSGLLASVGTPTFQMFDDTSWDANPDANGGTLNYAKAVSTYVDPLTFQILATNSATVPSTGGKVNLTVFSPADRQVSPRLAVIVLGRLGTSGLALPGIQGKFGLQTAGLVVLPSLNLNNTRGITSYPPFTTPALARGTNIATQVAMLDPVKSVATLGNTAQITVQ